MMVFVDTWAWLALAHKRDPYHAAAVQQHRAFRNQKAQSVTSEYVLTEVITALFPAILFARPSSSWQPIPIRSGRALPAGR